MADLPLKGRNAVVTGGSRGIGQAICMTLAREGANVFLCYTSESSKAKAEQVVSDIHALKNGTKAGSCQVDVSTKTCGEELLAGAKAFYGSDLRVHILVHNAGVQATAKLGEIPVDSFDWMFHINVRGPMLISQSFLPFLVKGGGGRIILMSSVAARGGYPTLSVYGSSKACVELLAHTWAEEFGRKDLICCNCVSPGPISSDMWHRTPQEFQDAITSILPNGGVGTPQHVADIVSFLASDKAQWVNGSTIDASCGMWAI